MKNKRQPNLRVSTVEEQLLLALERFLLLADIFELQVVAPEHVREGGLSPAACSSLTDLCRRASIDLRSLLDGLPSEIVNWTPRPPKDRRNGVPNRRRFGHIHGMATVASRPGRGGDLHPQWQVEAT